MSHRSKYLVLVLLALVAGRSSRFETGDIALDHTFGLATEAGVWVATGEGWFEDENGNVRRREELIALNQGTDRFVSVDAEPLT